MADNITVTFGGREVVLEPDGHWFTSGSLTACERVNMSGSPFGWEAWAFVRGIDEEISAYGNSPQTAASALESKLRSLRDAINQVLGDK